jgi:aldose 1-epimerase
VARQGEGGRARRREGLIALAVNVPAVRLAVGAAAVAILPAVGGALGAFMWRGAPVLRPTRAVAIAARDVRRTSCYPLIPYSNRVRDARLRYAGADFTLARNFGDHPHAIHGVGWQREWKLDRADATSALLHFDHGAAAEHRSAWPWPFRATQAFDLAATDDGAALTLTLTIVNIGGAAFPFGLGWHPFFPRDAATTLRFEAREVWLNDATELPVERVAATDAWSFAKPRSLGAATIDNVFAGWQGSATLDGNAAAPTITIDADGACNRLVVFAPAGRDFVALEPVTHETDAFNRAEAGARDTGMRVLAPGAEFSCTMRIRVASRPTDAAIGFVVATDAVGTP